MPGSIRVDLHCHTRHSDGKLRPEELADYLAAQGVVAAALTDHDTVEGLAAFRAALARHGIGFLSGVEITTFHKDHQVDVLAYGFDAENAELVAALAATRTANERLRASRAGDFRAAQLGLPEGTGHLQTADAIALIHRAGGKAFLAHPLTTMDSLDALNELISELKPAQLDGIEALYGCYPEQEQRALLQVAQRHGLLTSAGTDLHDPAQGGASRAVDMPAALWKAFRDAVTAGSPSAGAAPVRGARPDRRRFVFHVIVPSALAIVLFALALWGFVLPTFERSLLDRKRETIRELTNSAWSVLAEAHAAETRGELSREAAKRMAAARIEAMRYGREGKDYFWVQDMTPRIIMHPYRRDLNQQDVTTFVDARGVRIFVEFADVVRRRGEGYIEYVWQWKDDPRRLAAKESYVKGFEPWGWIIGTGIYIDDVKHEISRLERGIVYSSLAIVVAVAGLLLFVIRESFKLERDRTSAEEQLRDSNQRYRSLIEASTEGALLVMDGRCRYANPVLLKLLGRTAQQVELLELDDVLPHTPANAEAHARLERLRAGEDAQGGVEARLRRADGSLIECVLSFSPFRLGDRNGVILLARDVASQPRAASPEVVVRLGDGPALCEQISQAQTPEQVVAICRSAPRLADGWIAGGVHPRHVARMIADTCDAATVRLIDLAERQLGVPPAPFAFIALGSQGRREQSLFTDQDNAILLADAVDPAGVWPYFTELGKCVCGWLNDAGYVYCRGNVMAQNPDWCLPLAAWKKTFRRWIANPEPRELLEVCVFFDLRTIRGPADLEADLRRDIGQAIAECPGFLPHFAQNALQFKPPIRLFGHILSTGEQSGKLDLKAAMMPIVNFARLYAMKHQLATTGTLERLGEMTDRELLAESTREDLTYAYEFLMRLRIEHQASRLRAGQPPDNAIALRDLSRTEQVLLREAFAQIDAVQKKISYEFLGGT